MAELKDREGYLIFFLTVPPFSSFKFEDSARLKVKYGPAQ